MSSRASAAAVPLRQIAVVRTGDKGDLINVAVVPFDYAHYDLLKAHLTVERVAAAFAHLRPASVRRYEVDGFAALNFVIEGVLDGGVSRSRSLDGHGKALSALVAELPIRRSRRSRRKPSSEGQDNREKDDDSTQP